MYRVQFVLRMVVAVMIIGAGINECMHCIRCTGR